MKLFIRLSLLLLVLTTVSCSSPTVENGSEAMYASLAEQADVIFVGRVDYISTADSNAQQQIAFTVTEALVDGVNLGSGVVLTTVPSDQLLVGNEIIVFANQQILEAGGGQTAVLRPIQNDGSAFVAVDARETILNVIAQ